MITAVLSMTVLWCLFYGRIPVVALALLCVGLGLVFVVFGGHTHTQFLTIDVFAQTSRLHVVNPSLKFWTVLTLIVLCIAARNPAIGLLMTAVMLVVTVYFGGIKLRDYISLMMLPVSFVLLSVLALLFEVTEQYTGVLGIPIFSCWIGVTSIAQTRAALVLSRALSAVSCLYFLSLTTPMVDLIGVLRRIRCPNVFIELMYLIYRYIFILLSMYHNMCQAAKSRLGYTDYRTSMSTTGNICANLLARSYLQANRNFDAMESRCYDAEIRFLENEKRITGLHASIAIILIALNFIMLFMLR